MDICSQLVNGIVKENSIPRLNKKRIILKNEAKYIYCRSDATMQLEGYAARHVAIIWVQCSSCSIDPLQCVKNTSPQDFMSCSLHRVSYFLSHPSKFYLVLLITIILRCNFLILTSLFCLTST